MEERRKLILRNLEETFGYNELSVAPEASTSQSSFAVDHEKQDEALRTRLERIGYKVGCCMTERYGYHPQYQATETC
jgi:hypothetical protein